MAGRLDARRFVYVDEMGASTSLLRSTSGRVEYDETTSEHCATTGCSYVCQGTET
jgi:hypothetical protein